jgi:hypothetical protein
MGQQNGGENVLATWEGKMGLQNGGENGLAKWRVTKDREAERRCSQQLPCTCNARAPGNVAVHHGEVLLRDGTTRTAHVPQLLRLRNRCSGTLVLGGTASTIAPVRPLLRLRSQCWGSNWCLVVLPVLQHLSRRQHVLRGTRRTQARPSSG